MKEYYLTITNDEILPFVTRWIELKMIMLSKINQGQRGKYCMIPLVWNLKKLIS
jgi:hypothetical protein